MEKQTTLTKLGWTHSREPEVLWIPGHDMNCLDEGPTIWRKGAACSELHVNPQVPNAASAGPTILLLGLSDPLFSLSFNSFVFLRQSLRLALNSLL